MWFFKWGQSKWNSRRIIKLKFFLVYRKYPSNTKAAIEYCQIKSVIKIRSLKVINLASSHISYLKNEAVKKNKENKWKVFSYQETKKKSNSKHFVIKQK